MQVLIEEQRLDLYVVVYLTLTDPLRIQLWSQDRWNQTKSNRDHDWKKNTKHESRQKKTDKKVVSKGHRRQEEAQKRPKYK